MISLFIGTRPELIKLRPVYKALRSLGLPVRVCYVKQHLAIEKEIRAFAPTALTFNHVASGPSPSGGIALQTFKELYEPDVKLAIVQGDTATAVGAAIAMAYQQIPVVHVEAGLRTQSQYNTPAPNQDPFPEELNRQVISRIAALHLCPTYGNEQNLVREDVSGTIKITGNPSITALNAVLDDLPCSIRRPSYDDTSTDDVLVTCHRRENWPHMGVLAHELSIVAKEIGPTRRVTWIKHPNAALYANVWIDPTIEVMVPLSHESLITLMLRAALVVTDSGGMIEEATWLRKRRIMLRAETERPEAQAPLVAIHGCHVDILNALSPSRAEPSEGSRYAFGDVTSAMNCANAIADFYKAL